MKTTLFWAVTSCKLAAIYHTFERTFAFQLQITKWWAVCWSKTVAKLC